jgi:hypothetical protein
MKKTALFVSCVLATLAVLPAQADVVTDWNKAALQIIRENRTPPPRASRALAMLHAAIYDAVNGITRTHEPYLVESIVPLPASASKEAAASAAARAVLDALFPTNAPAFDNLYANILSALPDDRRKLTGIQWGQSVAAEILAARANDGSAAVVVPLPALAPGDWVATPAAFAPYLLPQWAFVDCFSMTHPAQFRPPGPPALSSAAWAAAFNEVKALGALTNSTRTPDQSQIALFWADGAGTETPPGHWNSIAQDVGAALGNTLDENARLFALLNLAMADAAVCAWDAKYHFHNWRPITAIRNADTDGNPATEADATWSSFIATPPFPDYVSGHSTFSGAASTILAVFYGTDSISFTTGSDFLPGVVRSFTSFSAASEEAMNSRLYGGIHYRFANEDGLVAGQGIGEWTATHYLLPKGNRSRR